MRDKSYFLNLLLHTRKGVQRDSGAGYA